MKPPEPPPPNDELPQPGAAGASGGGPVSAFAGPVDGLIRNRNLAPPSQPGALAALERFEVLRLIGAGAMGLVFLARDPESGAKVAIKLLRPELAVQPAAVHRFLVEVRHLRRMQHPHILGILEVSERQEGPFFVMPYLETGSLAGLLRDGAPLEHTAILRIASQIAQALQFAHGRGITHRDLKPANILLDREGKAFLTDFGLARTMLNDSFVDVQSGHCEGTAPYMSPALAAGQAEDTRCDIYAFGALLYEMLTGQAPYQGDTTAEVLEKVRQGPPASIFKRNPKAAPELVAVAEGAMARSQRDRYASMADIVADLERVGNGQQPLGPHGQWRAPRRWPTLLRRRPLATAGVAALALLLGWSVWRFQPRLNEIQRIVSPEVSNWITAQVGDWDGDQRPEVFVTDKRRCLAFASNGELECTFAPSGEVANQLEVCLVGDVNRDGKDDVFLTWAGGGLAHCAAFNRNKFAVLDMTVADESVVHPQMGLLHTGLAAHRIVDLNHDGRRAVLALAITGWTPGRGLHCFDAQTGAPLWSLRTAPSVTEIALIDMDGDGKEEVVFGSQAVSNGVKLEDGTDDSHCYLYAVSSQGSLLWRIELGDNFTKCWPLVARGSSSRAPRLYAAVHAAFQPRRTEGKDELGRVVELDLEGKELARYEVGVCLQTCLVDDLNNDGEAEILVTDAHGFLHVLDSGLEPLARQEITPNAFTLVDLRLIAVTNLAQGAAKQLVFASSQVQHLSGDNVGNNHTNVMVLFSHRDSIQVWDRSLRRVADYTVAVRRKEQPAWSIQLADWDGDGVPEIVWLGQDVRVLKLKRGW